MNDLLLWRLFEQEPIDVDQVEQLLRDLPGRHVFPFLEPIVRCIEAGPAPLRPAAIDALGRYVYDQKEIPNPLLRRLVPCLDDSSPDVRAAAVRIIARHGARIESAIYALFHRDPAVRLECARVWKFGPATLRWLLLDPGARDAAVSQLSKSLMSGSTAVLADFLRDCLDASALTVEQCAAIAGEIREHRVLGRLILRIAGKDDVTGFLPGPADVDHSHDALHSWIKFSLPPGEELARFLAACLGSPSSRSQLFEFIRPGEERQLREDVARNAVIRSILSQPEWRASLTAIEVAVIASRMPFVLTLRSIPLDLRLSALLELDVSHIHALGVDDKVENLVNRILWEIEVRGKTRGTAAAIVLTLAALSPRSTNALEHILARHPGLLNRVAAAPEAVAEFLAGEQDERIWRLAELLAEGMREPARMLAPLCIKQYALLRQAPDRIFVTWGQLIVDRMAGMDLKHGDDFVGAMLTLRRLAPHLTVGQDPSTAGRSLGKALSRLLDGPANGALPENASISLCGSLLTSFTADELVFPIASAIEALPPAHRRTLLGAIVRNEVAVPPAVADLCTAGDDEERRLLEVWRGISGVGPRSASFESSGGHPGTAIIDDAVAHLIESVPDEALGSALERIVTTDAVRGVCSRLFLCQSPEVDSASAAAKELLEMGADAVHELCTLIFSGVPLGRLLIRIVADSSAYPLAEVHFRQAVRDLSADTEARFEAAVQLSARGDIEARSEIPAIVNFKSTTRWFEEEDWAAIEGLGFSEFDLAVAVVTSPQSEAFPRALTVLLEAQIERGDPVVASALRRFLDCGTERHAILREKAAERLAALGDWSGAAVLMAADRFHAKLRTAPPAVKCILAAAEVLRDRWGQPAPEPQIIDSLGEPGTLSNEMTERIMRMIVDDSSSHALRAMAVRWLGRRAPKSRDAKLKALASTFAWGVKTARELTGKSIAIHITPTETAFTEVSGRSVFVNPIALLRGDDDATDVVKGLILHELGHHRFNSGTEWRAIEAESRAEKKRALLNLVQDEHLERNLRAISTEYGDALKKTAAWVFRRWEREIPADLLLERLGIRSFEALTRLRLEPGTEGVRVKLGSLLSALEGEQGSYAKFLPALRLGLGNRTGDEKVGAGLALFKSDFRRSSPERMLEIARELARIFHDDEVKDAPSLMELLAELSHRAHHPSEGELGEIAKHGRGITDQELQAAIDRELHEAGDSSDANKSAPPALTVNMSQDESFARIDDVRAMTFDPEAAREYVREVARWSRHLRRAFERLGLNMVQERRRLRGHSVDRGALLGAVLRGDPRVLKARRMEFATDLFLGVVIDCSGSMADDDNIEKAKSFAYLIAEAVKELRGVDARFLGFTDSEIFDAGTALRCSAHALEAGGGNNDAAALWHAAQLALASRRSAKLIVMISDGLPTECSVEALRAFVKQLTRKKRLACAQVAVRPIEEICFPHYIELQSEELGASVREFARIVLRLVRQTLRAR